MKSNFVLYACDTETTGLDNEKNEIIEISLFRMSDEDQKTWFIKPVNVEHISADALRVNQHKIEDLKGFTKYGQDTYQDPKKVLAEIENWMMEDSVSSEERVFVAQNSMFDIQFFQKLWATHNTEATFPFGNRPRTIDTIQIALFLDICSGERSEYYNLGSLVERYGVKKEKAHLASADCRMCKNVLLAQMKIAKRAFQL